MRRRTRPSEIEKIGRKAMAFTGDAGDEMTVVDAFAQTRAKLGEIDVAVACAGVLGQAGRSSRRRSQISSR